MRVIYLDELMAINLAVDYLILRTTAEIAGKQPSKLRLLVGAVLGAAYSGVLSVFPVPWLGMPPFHLLVMAVMLLISFGWQSSLLKLSICFAAVSAAFAGTVMAISLALGYPQPDTGLRVHPRLLLLSIGICYFLISAALHSLKRCNLDGREMGLRIFRQGKSVSLKGMRDTGNRLKDPITGRRVIIVDRGAVEGLFNQEVNRILAAAKPPELQLEELYQTGEGGRFLVIPYHTVGIENGLMLCFYPDWVEAEGERREQVVIGLAPQPLTEKGGIQAIIN